MNPSYFYTYSFVLKSIFDFLGNLLIIFLIEKQAYSLSCEHWNMGTLSEAALSFLFLWPI